MVTTKGFMGILGFYWRFRGFRERTESPTSRTCPAEAVQTQNIDQVIELKKSNDKGVITHTTIADVILF